MPRTRSRIQVALGSSGLDSQPGREFLQERLGVFAFWNAVLSFGFLAFRLIAEGSLDPAFTASRVLAPDALLHALGASVAAIVYLVTRRSPPFQARTLHGLDAVTIVVIGGAYAAMGAYLATHHGGLVDEPRVAALTATLALVFTFSWHSVAVPMTPLQCAAVTALGVLPMAAVDVGIMGGGSAAVAAQASPVYGLAWLALTVVTCTVACDVVFGLRREVQRIGRLGQYTLEEKIGEGAMGLVYRASHAMLRRPTAIKLLPPGRAGETAVARFEREVQLTARLTHPNTVAIYDYGRTPDGVFYYAMELLEGLTLDELVRGHGAQEDGRTIQILMQAARALAEAHGLGVVHRDVKPANIMLTVRGGEPDVVKVLDFGLVRRVDRLSATSTATLETRAILAGTPLYLSPEAITTPDEIDGRSDLYALGGVGYYLATGQPLFEGRTVMEICGHHLHTPPVPPSLRAGRAVDPTLEAVILRCLSKSSADRPPTAGAMVELLAGSAAASRWTAADARQWWQGHRASARRAPSPVADPNAETVAVDLSDRATPAGA